jgi:hypothetical protein
MHYVHSVTVLVESFHLSANWDSVIRSGADFSGLLLTHLARSLLRL